MNSPFSLRSINSELLKNDNNEYEVVMLDIRDLTIREPKNQNHTYSMRVNTPRFQALVKSVGENGVREPITVCPHPEHEYLYDVLSGRHRIEASKINNLEKMPCIIKTGLSEDEEDTSEEIENTLIKALQFYKKHQNTHNSKEEK